MLHNIRRHLAARLMSITPIVIAAAILSSQTHAGEAIGPQIGKAAPSFTLQSMDGKPVALKDFKGKRVVLEWTNHECPFVKKHYESNNMQSLQEELTKDGTVWLSIISSAPKKQGYITAEKAKSLTESRKALPTEVLFDPSGNVGHSYAAKTTPHMYIIDEQGTLVYMGGIDSIPSADKSDIAKATNYVSAAVGELDQGKKISQPKTRPYGCSIKYDS